MNSQEYISSGIIESYILGLASAEEAGILECVMKNNEEVRAAFEEAQITLENLASAQAIAPPMDMKSKIWSQIQAQEMTPPAPIISISENEEPSTKVESLALEQEKPITKTIWKPISIAASFVLLGSILGNLYMINASNETEKEIALLQSQQKLNQLALQNATQKLQIVTNPNMKKVNLEGVGAHTNAIATVYWDTQSKEVYLSANSLQKAPEGMQYQLWAIVDGKPVSAGMYEEAKDSSVSLSQIPKAQAFAITLEKSGGSAVPTMENMYVMGEVKI